MECYIVKNGVVVARDRQTVIVTLGFIFIPSTFIANWLTPLLPCTTLHLTRLASTTYGDHLWIKSKILSIGGHMATIRKSCDTPAGVCRALVMRSAKRSRPTVGTRLAMMDTNNFASRLWTAHCSTKTSSDT